MPATKKKSKPEKLQTVPCKARPSLIEKLKLVCEKTERSKNFIANKALEAYCDEILSKLS